MMAVGYEKYFWLFEPNQDLQVYLLRDCEGTSARLAAHMQLTSHASLLARSRGDLDAAAFTWLLGRRIMGLLVARAQSCVGIR
jgi:hypothetical protein